MSARVKILEDFWTKLVPLGRPKKVTNVAALKAYAAQWFYLLYGLRDGQPCPNEKIAWSGWRWRPRPGFSEGKIVRIVFAKLILRNGVEVVSRIFEVDTFFPRQDTPGEDLAAGSAISEKKEKDSPIPIRFCFNLTPQDVFYLVFLPIPQRKDLWDALKRARQKGEMERVVEEIVRWIPPIPGYQSFRDVLKKRGADLLQAKRLWIYPRNRKRSTSEEKRIAFFAKALAGLMFSIAPATAAKRLSRWKVPKLWITEYDKENEK